MNEGVALVVGFILGAVFTLLVTKIGKPEYRCEKEDRGDTVVETCIHKKVTVEWVGE